jgi:hypothetical protein
MAIGALSAPEESQQVPSEDQQATAAGTKNDFRYAALWQAGIFVSGLLTAVFAITVYALSGPAKGETFSTLALFGAAACVVGAFFGFLFGVPRSSVAVVPTDKPDARGEDSPSQAAMTTQVSSVTGAGTNTPIEQIADWVTKLLVGATLTQLGKIPAAATALFTAMAVAVGDRASGPAFVGGLTIFSAVMGFVFGWLVTRAYLPWIFGITESRLRVGSTSK